MSETPAPIPGWHAVIRGDGWPVVPSGVSPEATVEALAGIPDGPEAAPVNETPVPPEAVRAATEAVCGTMILRHSPHELIALALEAAAPAIRAAERERIRRLAVAAGATYLHRCPPGDCDENCGAVMLFADLLESGAPSPVPGLMIAARPKGGWVIACASGRSAIGCFADPEAALACVTEIGPLADWDSASGGQIRMPIDVIRQVNGIVARWGGGEIAVKPDPPLDGSDA